MIFNTIQNAKKPYPASSENTTMPQFEIKITKILPEILSKLYHNTANPNVPLLDRRKQN